MAGRTGEIIVVGALAAGVLAGCASAGEGAGAGRAIPSGRTIPFALYTHCGIDEARVGSTYFEAETPLSDGSGNPPEGWGNPTQLGTMTLRSATGAVFTDPAGHVVKFRARPGARAFKRTCA